MGHKRQRQERARGQRRQRRQEPDGQGSEGPGTRRGQIAGWDRAGEKLQDTGAFPCAALSIYLFVFLRQGLMLSLSRLRLTA